MKVVQSAHESRASCVLEVCASDNPSAAKKIVLEKLNRLVHMFESIGNIFPNNYEMFCSQNLYKSFVEKSFLFLVCI